MIKRNCIEKQEFFFYISSFKITVSVKIMKTNYVNLFPGIGLFCCR